MGISTALSSALLYAPGAFFFYPHKPLMQAIFGDAYSVGYKYFRRDHSEPRNLCLHLIALVWTILANFGLLASLDSTMSLDTLTGIERPISLLTGALWSVMLLSSPAPLVVSLLSSLCIWAGFAAAPFLEPRQLEVGAMAAFFMVLVIAKLVFKHRAKTVVGELLADVKHMAKLFGLALVARLVAQRWAGALSHYTAVINPALVVLMLVLGSLPKPTVPAVMGGALVVRAFGELTAQDALLFFGAAFVAQISQGVSHDVTKQKATLLSHENSDEAREVKLAFEWSHVVYFPNLLLHSCHQSLLQL